MNLSQAKALRSGTTLEHKTEKNRDGSAVRAKVNGTPKTWKRTPARVKVPLKYGMYTYFYLSAGNTSMQHGNMPDNLADWSIQR